jgi:hypothetical protein
MRLTDHVTLNFNNKMSTDAVFLDIEKAFDTTWHPGLLYKLSKLEFSTNLIKLLRSFNSQRIFRISVEVEILMPREMQAGVPQGSVLSPTLFNLCFNDAPQTLGVHLALFQSVSQSQSQSHIATDGQSVFLSWCRAPSGAHDQISVIV